ncbi:hypothetical protein ACFOWZ_40515 [Lentzea rhizosphaerae]|uniref:Uncharacterized protein n=1 Tax=Lentzea rhizosphaerae TaxID=2041025 RepID=A0ABV8C7X2_9PSEU
MRRLVVLVLLLTACGGPGIGPKITRRPESGSPAGTTTVSAPSPSRQVLGSAPADLRTVDWPKAALPARFCGIDEPVRLKDGQAAATSATWGRILLLQNGVAHGDVDGDGQDEAAVGLMCDTGGGTAASQLAFGYVVVRSVDGNLELVGEISTTTMRDDAYHVPLLAEPKFEKGVITVEERWYRPSDANCCPSGASLTKWWLRDGTLKPDPAVQVS